MLPVIEVANGRRQGQPLGPRLGYHCLGRPPPPERNPPQSRHTVQVLSRSICLLLMTPLLEQRLEVFSLNQDSTSDPGL